MMTKYYIQIGILSVIVISALIYGFVIAGSPLDARNQKFDQDRVADIISLRSEIENYYSINRKLPESLNNLTDRSYSENKIDPETKKQYEYRKVSNTSYKLCAQFAGESNDKRDYYYSYENGQFRHPRGNHCFDLQIPTNLISISQITPKTLVFEDKNVDSVVSDAKNIQFSNFPYGFFSSSDSEWGLINYSNDPVTVTLKFTHAVGLKSITNTFTNCPPGCYRWSVSGIKSDGAVVNLVTDLTDVTSIIPDGMVSKVTISSDEKFSELKILVVRKGGVDSYVHWKKIKIEYK